MTDKSNLRLVGGRPVEEEPEWPDPDECEEDPRVYIRDLEEPGTGAGVAIAIVVLLAAAVFGGLYLALHR
jgi:hypothetical protein